ncbi:MAG: hypothetical protein ACXQS6_01535 [Candidatus Syntropharchaeales archaeon]
MTWTVKIEDTTDNLAVNLGQDQPTVEETVTKELKIAKQSNKTKSAPIVHDTYVPVHKFTIVSELRIKNVDGKTTLERKQDLMTLAKRGQRNLTFTWGSESWTVKIQDCRIAQVHGEGTTYDRVVINLIEVDPDKSK